MSRRGRAAKEKNLGKRARRPCGRCAVDPELYKLCGGPELLDGCGVAPWDGDKSDCSGTSAYRSGSCTSMSAELLVGAQKWQFGSRRLGVGVIIGVPSHSTGGGGWLG